MVMDDCYHKIFAAIKRHENTSYVKKLYNEYKKVYNKVKKTISIKDDDYEKVNDMNNAIEERVDAYLKGPIA